MPDLSSRNASIPKDHRELSVDEYSDAQIGVDDVEAPSQEVFKKMSDKSEPILQKRVKFEEVHEDSIFEEREENVLYEESFDSQKRVDSLENTSENLAQAILNDKQSEIDGIYAEDIASPCFVQETQPDLPLRTLVFNFSSAPEASTSEAPAVKPRIRRLISRTSSDLRKMDEDFPHAEIKTGVIEIAAQQISNGDKELQIAIDHEDVVDLQEETKKETVQAFQPIEVYIEEKELRSSQANTVQPMHRKLSGENEFEASQSIEVQVHQHFEASEENEFGAQHTIKVYSEAPAELKAAQSMEPQIQVHQRLEASEERELKTSITLPVDIVTQQVELQLPKSILKSSETTTAAKSITFQSNPETIYHSAASSSSSTYDSYSDEEEDVWSRVDQHRFQLTRNQQDIPPPLPKTPPPSVEEEETQFSFA